MSDGAIKRQTPVRQSRTRRKGAPRGGRHGLSRPVVIAPSDEGGDVAELAPVNSPRRSRRPSQERPAVAPALSREAEIAYIRADMRKLLVIASGLLALMFVILAIVGR